MAPPRPTPVRNRSMISIDSEVEYAATILATPKKNTQKRRIVFRPHLSASGPNKNAPDIRPNRPDPNKGAICVGVSPHSELMAGARKPIEAVSNPSIPTTRKHSTTMVIWKAVKPRLLISSETLTIEVAGMFHPISVCVVPIFDERDLAPERLPAGCKLLPGDGSCALNSVSRRACFSGVDGAGCRNGVFGKTAPAIEPRHGVVHLVLALGSQHGIAKLGVWT